MTGEAKRTVVVGGGIIGACSAYYLAKAGRDVTLIDSGAFGSGCSHANCGYVSPSHVLPLAAPGAIRSLMKVMARPNSPIRVKPGVVLGNPGWFLKFATRCNEADMLAAGAAIRPLLQSSRSLYEDMIRDEQIACEWEPKGLLFVFRTQAAMDHYAEVDHLLRDRFDTPATRIDGPALNDFEPALKPGLPGAWYYEGDAFLRPDKFMAELRRVLLGLGVTIHEHRAMSGLVREGGRVTGVRTASGDLPADDVVVALGAWTPTMQGELGVRVPIQPGKGYSITFPAAPGRPDYPMIFEEDRVAITPFQSGFRIGSMMEFAGRDATIDRGRLALLTATADRYLKVPSTGTPDEEWTGWRPMTPDNLPLIGPSPKFGNVWLAAGHNMLGISMGPATGKLVAEMIGGTKAHVDPRPYVPSRA